MVRHVVAAHCPHAVSEVRGRGLLIGIDFVSAELATEFSMSLIGRRVIPSYSLNAHHVLRLTPPAVLDGEDLDWLARALTGAARDLTLLDPPSPAALPSNPEETPCVPSSST